MKEDYKQISKDFRKFSECYPKFLVIGCKFLKDFRAKPDGVSIRLLFNWLKKVKEKSISSHISTLHTL